ncbi:hypothetical protein GZH46_00883, partial [Fragariocoptes setiger]
APRLAYWAVPGAFIAAASSVVNSLLDPKLDLTPLSKASIATVTFFTYEVWQTYTTCLHRLPSYLLGLALGHMLYAYEMAHNGAPDFAKHPALTVIAWLRRLANNRLTLTIVIASIVAGPLAVRTVLLSMPSIGSAFDIPNAHLVIPVATTPMFSALCVSVINISLVLGGLRRLAYLTGWPVWRLFSRIALTVLLVHVPVCTYYHQSMTQVIQLTPTMAVATIVALVVCSYAISFAVYICFEAPISATINYVYTVPSKPEQ